ncbi:MAG TPA: HRDC domain-containing protein [Candidatus Ozemobacteraceae bacterium]|nr:HRDC domain-containing protein [Candidatus Ozemobacteraceae bacterium]
MESYNVEPLLEGAQVIEDTESLSRFLDDIAGTDVLAVDTESAGFYKFRAAVNLIQVSTRKRAALLDPQAISDFTPLVRFAETENCEWLFHGGDYDAGVLARELKVRVRKLFDTRIAAEMIGSHELGLSALAERYLGFALDKKLQRCDWSRRPLTPAMIRYGLLDAICLIPVRDELQAELEHLGRLDWAREEFEQLTEKFVNHLRTQPHEKPFAYLIKGSSRMPPRQVAILKEVWTLRESIAEKLDRAPFMVLGNQALLDIARQAPRSLAGLSVIKQIGRDFIARHGREVQEAVKRGLEAPTDGLLPPARPRREQTFFTSWEGDIVRALRERRNAVANRINMPAALLTDPEVLSELAKTRPVGPDEMKKIPGFRNWQVDLLCEEYLPFLKKQPPVAPVGRRRRRRKKPAGPADPGGAE